jgi:hypothetical protein
MSVRISDVKFKAKRTEEIDYCLLQGLIEDERVDTTSSWTFFIDLALRILEEDAWPTCMLVCEAPFPLFSNSELRWLKSVLNDFTDILLSERHLGINTTL